MCLCLLCLFCCVFYVLISFFFERQIKSRGFLRFFGCVTIQQRTARHASFDLFVTFVESYISNARHTENTVITHTINNLLCVLAKENHRGQNLPKFKTETAQKKKQTHNKIKQSKHKHTQKKRKQSTKKKTKKCVCVCVC